MTILRPRIQSFASLRDEMIAVARGTRSAPAHAALPSVHSADMIARLLTPENRALMAVLRSEQPESVAQLAALTDRAPSNLTRTLEKLVSAGLVSMETIGRRKVPRAIAGKITIDIDPFSQADVVRVHAVAEGGARGAGRLDIKDRVKAKSGQPVTRSQSVAAVSTAKRAHLKARSAT